MKPGDLVTGLTRPGGCVYLNSLGLVLNLSPTIGTNIRMVEVLWEMSEETGLHSEKSLVVVSQSKENV